MHTRALEQYRINVLLSTVNKGSGVLLFELSKDNFDTFNRFKNIKKVLGYFHV
jgi:hypothetical protein